MFQRIYLRLRDRLPNVVWGLMFLSFATVLVMLLFVSAIPEKLTQILISRSGSAEPERISPGEFLTGIDINHWIGQNSAYDEMVGLYTSITKNRDIARIILNQSIGKEIPVSLAFALAWKESSFNPNAVSPRNRFGTRDWGLYQLNDGTRKDWTEEDFFDAEKNADSGLSYLQYCLTTMENKRLGLGAYNAGVFQVKSRGMPSSTAVYTVQILEYETQIDQIFNEYFISAFP